MALPWFDGVGAKEYFKDGPPRFPLCRLITCAQKATHKCSKGLCQMSFCATHAIHMHHKCTRPGCDEYAVTWLAFLGAECCKEHFLAWYGRCQTCKQPLEQWTAQVGHCSPCNGMWQHLKKQGVKGPFGWSVFVMTSKVITNRLYSHHLFSSLLQCSNQWDMILDAVLGSQGRLRPF